MLRTLIRMTSINNIRLSTCDGLAKFLAEKQMIITQAYGANAKEKACTLKGTSQEIRNYADLVSQKPDPDTLISKPSGSQVTDAVVDALFISYLLLDIAATWPEFRKHHMLLVLDVLNAAWDCKCTDVFDAIFYTLTEFFLR